MKINNRGKDEGRDGKSSGLIGLEAHEDDHGPGASLQLDRNCRARVVRQLCGLI